MIDLNLCISYLRKSDQKLFIVRRITRLNYVIYDPENSQKEDISHYYLRKNFKAKKESLDTFVKRKNKTLVSRSVRSRLSKGRKAA